MSIRDCPAWYMALGPPILYVTKYETDTRASRLPELWRLALRSRQHLLPTRTPVPESQLPRAECRCHGRQARIRRGNDPARGANAAGNWKPRVQRWRLGHIYGRFLRVDIPGLAVCSMPRLILIAGMRC